MGTDGVYVRYSRMFSAKLASHLRKGYRVVGASINFIVRWTKKETGEQCRIVLPIVYLER